MAARIGKKVVTARTAVILVIVLALGVFAFNKYREADAAPDARIAFAQCLKDKGAKFYGAYWCPHCQAQKKLFGKGVKNLDYIECAIPGNQRDQTQACKDAEVKSYPTWIFADGSRESGEQSLSDLAEKTGCELPATSS